DKISAACISVRVTSKIAYYFLPGTSPLFRSHSPMVLLIAGMVAYYKEQNLQFLDLGVSSIQGKPQETLRLFKQRMGAQECLKSTFTLDL
ncbi:MAG: GNAT family N-acetyltransferase, partial [Bacteroidota bacterium]